MGAVPQIVFLQERAIPFPEIDPDFGMKLEVAKGVCHDDQGQRLTTIVPFDFMKQIFFELLGEKSGPKWRDCVAYHHWKFVAKSAIQLNPFKKQGDF